MDYAKESLRLHGDWKGKIEMVATVPAGNREELSLAYTPGVAQPCLEIQKDISLSYQLTRRHNLCAVITDGSAVLGLGIADQSDFYVSACRLGRNGRDRGLGVFSNADLHAVGVWIASRV